MAERKSDELQSDKPSDCHLCHGTGKVIVRGSTDGHEWTYACHHNGTIAPINPWQSGGPGEGVQAGGVTITYGERTPSSAGLRRDPLASKVAHILALAEKALPGPWSSKVLRDYHLTPHDNDTPYVYGPNDTKVMCGLWPIHGPKPEDTAEAERQTFATIELVAALRNLIHEHGGDLAALTERLGVLSAIQACKTAKQQLDEHTMGDDMTPLERLRFFCSLAMNGQDWLDVEPFFDDLEKQTAPLPINRWLGEAVWHLGLTDSIKLVTPYGSAGDMVRHIVEKARDLERTANLRAADRGADHG